MSDELHIETLFAFIIKDNDGTEGVAGWFNGAGWTPMVGADMERVEQMKPLAQLIADSCGNQIQVVQFTTRTDVETIEPNRMVEKDAIQIDEKHKIYGIPRKEE